MPSKALLELAHDRVADPGQRRLRPGDRADAIHHVSSPGIDEHLEELFATFGVIRQGSVRKAEASLFRTVDAVENSTAVQGPEPEMPDQYRDNGPLRDRGLTREGLDPADIELLPGEQCCSCAFEVSTPVPNGDGCVVEFPMDGPGARDAYRAVQTAAGLGTHEETGRSFPADGRRARNMRSLRPTLECETALHEPARRQRSRTCRTDGTRSVTAADGRSCLMSDTSVAVARWCGLLSSSHHRRTARWTKDTAGRARKPAAVSEHPSL